MRHKKLVVAVTIGCTLATATPAAATSMQEYGRLLFADGQEALSARDDHESAARQFERALAYFPSGPDLLWNVSACYLMIGERDLAAAFFEKYVEKVPSCQSDDEMFVSLNHLLGQDPFISDEEDRRRLLGDLADSPCTVAPAGDAEGGDAPEAGASPDWRHPGWEARASELRAIGTRLYDEARGLWAGHNFQDALVKFERSFAYRPLRNTVWNMGSCHLKLGNRDLSTEFFRRYLDQYPSVRDDPAVRGALEGIVGQPPTINEGDRDGLLRMLDRAVRHAMER